MRECHLVRAPQGDWNERPVLTDGGADGAPAAVLSKELRRQLVQGRSLGQVHPASYPGADHATIRSDTTNAATVAAAAS